MELFNIHWQECGIYLMISFFILTAALVKIAYFNINACIGFIPESCALILLGTGVGIFINSHGLEDYIPHFSTDLFTYVLLPPIMIDSSFEVHHRHFVDNFGSIVLFAILGTLLNMILLTPSILFCQKLGFFRIHLSILEVFLFSTILSAVDPVAVLAIFQDVDINKSLYFLVFGESLLNDAVVIIVYSRISSLMSAKLIEVLDVLKLLSSFLVNTAGGLIIGVFYGTISSYLTKLTTNKNMRTMEPIILIILSYISYLSSQLIECSGIISIIICGLMQAQYACKNIAKKSNITYRYFVKILSSVSETIIFLFLGLSLVRVHEWDGSFAIFTIFFCIVHRFIVVFSLSFISNVYFPRLSVFNYEEQVLIAYGGLRGAIAFSLAQISDELNLKHSPIIVTTTLFVILFTVLVLGSTAKPVIKLLRVKTNTQQEKHNFNELAERVMRIVMNGIEALLGRYNVLKKILDSSDKFFALILIKDRLNVANDLKKQQISYMKQNFRFQMLDCPEKDIYPNINREVDYNEVVDEEGKAKSFSLEFTRDLSKPIFSIQKVERIIKIDPQLLNHDWV